MTDQFAIFWVILKRLSNSVIVLLILSGLIFTFMRAIPGDPVLNMLGEEDTTIEQYEALKAELGLDQPYYIQYFNWIFCWLPRKI